MNVLGVDVGGSGIKAAPVDTLRGELLADRKRFPTPQPATPAAVAKTLARLVKHFDWSGPIGCGFPAAVQNGIIRTASNVDQSWIATDAADLFSQSCGCKVTVINDADAAGLAEMRFGAGQGRLGVVVLITVGTGLGTAVFTQGVLLPNTELGHIIMDGVAAEKRASDAVRQEEDLTWQKWASRLDRYLVRLSELLWPDLFILGGGVSKKFSKFARHLTVPVEIIPAEMRNQAGIVGAGLAADHPS